MIHFNVTNCLSKKPCTVDSEHQHCTAIVKNLKVKDWELTSSEHTAINEVCDILKKTVPVNQESRNHNGIFRCMCWGQEKEKKFQSCHIQISIGILFHSMEDENHFSVTDLKENHHHNGILLCSLHNEILISGGEESGMPLTSSSYSIFFVSI